MQTCFNSCHLIPILVLYNQSSLSFNSNFCEKVFANSLKNEIYIKIERFLTFCSTIHVCLKKGCFDIKCSLSQNCFNRIVYKLKEIMGKVFFFFFLQQPADTLLVLGYNNLSHRTLQYPFPLSSMTVYIFTCGVHKLTEFWFLHHSFITDPPLL